MPSNRNTLSREDSNRLIRLETALRDLKEREQSGIRFLQFSHQAKINQEETSRPLISPKNFNRVK